MKFVFLKELEPIQLKMASFRGLGNQGIELMKWDSHLGVWLQRAVSQGYSVLVMSVRQSLITLEYYCIVGESTCGESIQSYTVWTSCPRVKDSFKVLV